MYTKQKYHIFNHLRLDIVGQVFAIVITSHHDIHFLLEEYDRVYPQHGFEHIEKNSRLFVNILQYILLKETFWILNPISMKLVFRVQLSVSQ